MRHSITPLLITALIGAPAIARSDQAALLETLNTRLLASHSATDVLEQWCADHRMAAPSRISAERAPGIDKPATAALREALGVGPDEPLRYRRVRLRCGAHVLSEADNWYVPARLTPEMNRALDQTDTPFGRVIQPLQPTRRTLSARQLWDAKAMPDALIEHRALVLDAAGRPIAEVVETYMRGVLEFER